MAMFLSLVGTLIGADFNRDGHPDYLLANNTTRQLAIWHLTGNNFVSGVYGPTLPAGWTIVGEADFNRDGYPDLLLYNPTTHESAIWYLRDGKLLGGTYLMYGTSRLKWINGYIPKAIDDMNYDGYPDIITFNPNTRVTYISLFANNRLLFSSTSTSINTSTKSELSPSTAADNCATCESITNSAVNTPQPAQSTQEFQGITLDPGWQIIESTDRQWTIINTSTLQTVRIGIILQPWANPPVFRGVTLIGPQLPRGWQLIGVMDFNLDGWNDYLLNGSLGVNAQWHLNLNNQFIGGVYGPRLPAGWSFAPVRYKTCAYGVNPTVINAPLSGGTYYVNVVTEFGCNWSWKSNAEWIVVATPYAKYGTGAIAVTVKPATAPRSGSMTVTTAGQTVMVYQGGKMTGHWHGVVYVNDCNAVRSVIVDLYLHQINAYSFSGTYTATNVPCRDGNYCWNNTIYHSENGTVDGTVNTILGRTSYAVNMAATPTGGGSCSGFHVSSFGFIGSVNTAYTSMTGTSNGYTVSFTK